MVLSIILLSYNDRIIYYTTATLGENAGDVRYTTFVRNMDKNIEVYISSPSMEETNYIAESII